MSFQPTAWFEAGLICCGFTFGITFNIRHITAMITTKNRIAITGSQFSAAFCRFCTNEVCAGGGAATGATFATACAWAWTSAACAARAWAASGCAVPPADGVVPTVDLLPVAGAAVVARQGRRTCLR